MTDTGRKIVDGLMLILIVVIALWAGIGVGTLLFWEVPIQEGLVTWSIIVMGTILAVTSVVCCCLRAWVREQQPA